MKLAELNKAIDELNSSASKMGDRYQEVGLACLQHLKDHGDIGPCNRLYLGMPKSTKSLAMGRWLILYGALKINGDRTTNKAQPMIFDKSKETDMDGAMAEKWWEAAPDRHITDEIDLQVAIKSLLNRLKDKRIIVGGVRKSPGEVETAVRTMASLVGLPVQNFHVDAETGKASVADSGKVGDIKPVEVPEEVKAAAKKVVDAASKGTTAPKADSKKPGVQQGETDMVTSATGRMRSKAEKPGTAGRQQPRTQSSRARAHAV